MSKLDELKKKYPTAKFEPQADCSKCKGVGEWYFDSDNAHFKGMKPCICIYIAPENLPIAKQVISDFVKRRKEAGDF